MRKNYFRNGLVIIIASLFILAAALPSVLSQDTDKESTSETRAIIIVDDDGNDCPEADYDNIQEAIDNAGSGDEIRVCNGTYVENVIVDKGLTLKGGYNGGISTIDGNGSGCVVTITALINPVTLDNFHITNSGDFRDDSSSPWTRDAGICISVKFGHTIINNNISNNNGNGIYIFNGAGNNIESNTISNNAWDGIGAYQCTQTKIYYNTVEENGYDGIYFLRGLYPKVFYNTVKGNGWGSSTSAGIKFHRTRGLNNLCIDIGFNCIIDNIGCGITLKMLSFSNSIQKNNIYGNGKFGVYLERWCFLNGITNNNFCDNNADKKYGPQAFAMGSFFNSWYHNYWDDLEDKIWYRLWGMKIYIISWPFNIDTAPALVPFDYPC